ncbi:DUF2332 domain-containing protein [Streptomyces sp. NPDC006872]|uniref:DUF2332 domain-containing protein n=1 Tax=Streptomyces sp. NPDC006872 TaxID=3155720 RepID=UPI0033F5C797
MREKFSAAATDLLAMAHGMKQYAPVTATVLARLADDVAGNGPITRLVGGHPEASLPLFFLRVPAGVRWLGLSGLTPECIDHISRPPTGMSDQAYADRTWELFQDAVLAYPQEIRAALDRPVQQHQPSRAGVLLRGLAMLDAQRIRLLEIGACAGLNLLLDKYHWFGPGWQWGDRSSPVRLAATGKPPGALEIVDRAGCDLAPRDAGNAADAMILRSFLPHEREVEQLELEEAMQLAATQSVRVARADAVSWLESELMASVHDKSVRTVLWHSLFWNYLTSRQKTEIEKLLQAAARRIPLAKVSYEPHDWATAPRLQVTVYS